MRYAPDGIVSSHGLVIRVLKDRDSNSSSLIIALFQMTESETQNAKNLASFSSFSILLSDSISHLHSFKININSDYD